MDISMTYSLLIFFHLVIAVKSTFFSLLLAEI